MLAAPDLPPPPPAEILVVGTGLPAAIGDVAYDVVTIPRERLADVASGRLEDVLRDAAGFQQFRRADSRSAHPTAQGATLRGLGGNASSRALVVLDGVPQVDPFGGWVSFAAYDPSRLGEVRLVRGGGSGVWGPGALAGTIELRSAGPAELPPFGGAVARGSRRSLDADLAISAPLSGGFAAASVSYARGNGFVPIVRRDRGPADRPAGHEQASVALRGVIPVATDVELQASGLVFDDRRDRGTAFTDNRNRGADASLRLVGRGRWSWEVLTYFQLRDFASDFASIDAGRLAATQSLDQYSVPATGLGGRIELRPPALGRLELRIGGDLRRVAGETRERFSFTAGSPTRRREAGGSAVTAGAFAEATVLASERLRLTAGGRIDRWRIGRGRLNEFVLQTGTPLSRLELAGRTGWEPTARGGALASVANGVDLRAAAYLGWRLPTLNELYRPFRAGSDATAPNPALSPERVRGVDGGVDWTPFPGFRLSATGFWNRLEDAIANVTLGSGPGTYPVVGFVGAGGAYRQRQNVRAIRARGLELDAQAVFGPWRLAASWALIDARLRAGGAAAALDGLRPAQVPAHQGSATLAWSPDGGPRLSATVRHLSGQWEDDQNARRLRDATTLDGTARVPLTRGLALEVRGENLADATVETAVSGPGTIERAAPRTIWIGLRLGEL